MTIFKNMFFILIAFLSHNLCVVASHNPDDEIARHHQQVIIDQAKALYKKVNLDKDPTSAKSLLDLGTSNKCVADYLKTQRNAPDQLKKVIQLGKQIDAEELSINSSIAKALEIMNKSQNLEVIKAATWLKNPLPGNRIQCCTVELLSFDHGNPTQEAKNILDILSDTDFGYQQVEKAKSKLIQYSTISQ
ncbi:MAG: hypothetical protein ACRYGR_05385 [Janthinobacterium lividum]